MPRRDFLCCFVCCFHYDRRQNLRIRWIYTFCEVLLRANFTTPHCHLYVMAVCIGSKIKFRFFFARHSPHHSNAQKITIDTESGRNARESFFSFVGFFLVISCSIGEFISKILRWWFDFRVVVVFFLHFSFLDLRWQFSHFSFMVHTNTQRQRERERDTMCGELCMRFLSISADQL